VIIDPFLRHEFRRATRAIALTGTIQDTGILIAPKTGIAFAPSMRLFLVVLLVSIPFLLPAEEPDVAVPRLKEYKWMTLEKWKWFHEGDLARGAEGPVEVLFLGDSITECWEKEGTKVWKEAFVPLQGANFGVGGDTTQNVLWRITVGGALERVHPRVVVLMIGTNNFGLHDDSPEAVVRGIRAIVKSLRTQRPECHVLVLDLFPRGEPGDQLRKDVETANRLIDGVGKGDPMVSHLRIWDEFTDGKGSLPPEIMPDKLHLSEKGYEIWAKAMVPTLRELLAE